MKKKQAEKSSRKIDDLRAQRVSSRRAKSVKGGWSGPGDRSKAPAVPTDQF